MKNLYSKQFLYLHYKDYLHYVSSISKRNKTENGPPVPVPNISGVAGESLSYHLIQDKIIPHSYFGGDIENIELRGDTKSGVNVDGDVSIGGDIVIKLTNGKILILEVKSFSSISGFTSESPNNKNASILLGLDFSEFRKGNTCLSVNVLRNFKRNTQTIHIEGNNQKKLNLKKDLKRAQGTKDFDNVCNIDVLHYLKTTNPFSNGHFDWGGIVQ